MEIPYEGEEMVCPSHRVWIDRSDYPRLELGEGGIKIYFAGVTVFGGRRVALRSSHSNKHPFDIQIHLQSR